MSDFPHYHQLDSADCGPTCLRMIARHYGRSYTLETLRERSFITREGVSMLGICDAAESIGMRTVGVKIGVEQLASEAMLPCILHWNQNHFVVLYKVGYGWRGERKFYIADPATQKVVFSQKELEHCWLTKRENSQELGMALLLEPGPEFMDYEDERRSTRRDLFFFARYLTPYRGLLLQVVVGMLVSMVLQMMFPFLTQALVDEGIHQSDLSFITLILIAQLVLFLSQLSVGFIRSWIMLHVNTRVDIALISDFLMKLMRLPLRYFDTKNTGDIMQRIGDHGRIKAFLMGNSVNIMFSLFNFVVFGGILAYYSPMILMVFLIGNTGYVIWVLSFMKYRRELDIRRFSQSAGEQSKLIQLIQGMQEIKLNNCEKQKRWEWERIQVRLFKISLRGLAIGQIQQIGSVFFTQSTGILISYIAAKGVVEGMMTLGMMMSLTYIIGQVSAPIGDFIGFAQAWQDAKISLERLNEVHRRRDEEQGIHAKLASMPERRDIRLEGVSFSYSGAARDYALEDVSLTIPEHKVTAIVGASGSGKTTIVKLLLGFYPLNKGCIKVGETPLGMINPHVWRSRVGAVMQDNYIFSDTIARNIVVGEEKIDTERLRHAVKVANIGDFIYSLPMGFDTRIGMEGSGISQGQRQRILIARAVYKAPEYIFLDEATNSLDGTNESVIMRNLKDFYKGRTVVIVAHRLSTVRHADNIIVLEKGRVVEEGTHEQLLRRRGTYCKLVKSQLKLED